MEALDPTITLGALLVAVPATISAISSLRTSKKIATNHGKNIGEHVEKIGDDVYDLTRAFIRHADQDEENFAKLEEALRVATQDRADVKKALVVAVEAEQEDRATETNQEQIKDALDIEDTE